MPELVTLVDDFQDNSINTSLWVTAGTVAETGGRARLTPGTTYAIWQAVSAYDMTESQITIEVPVVPPTGISGTLTCGMIVEQDSSYQIALRKDGTNLVCTQNINGVTSDLAFAVYSATNHRFWRIRKSSNTVFWETSPNGSGSFFIQYSANVSTLFPMGAVTPFFYTGYSGFESAPGTFQIEGVNVPARITASGASLSGGSVAFFVSHIMSASGGSISDGSAAILLRRNITAAGASTSAGSVAMSISSPGPISMTASGGSLSAGTASFIILTPGQMTAAGASFSSGSVILHVNYMLTAVGASFSTGTAAITVIAAPTSSSLFYLFEPPVALDNPPTLPNPRPRYINSFAKWQGGQRRGRTVLKTGSTYLTIDSPTIDQCNAADAPYLGGHVYTVTQMEANSLSASGYVVTPILTDVTAPILNIIAPHPGANVDQIVRVLLTTSEPSNLSGTLSTSAITYPITILSTAFSINTSSLPNASYRLTITATDDALNSTSAYVDFQIIHAIQIGIGAYPSLATFPSLILYPTGS